MQKYCKNLHYVRVKTLEVRMKKFAAFVISSSLALFLFSSNSHAFEFDSPDFNFKCAPLQKPQLPPFATSDNGVLSIGTKVIVKKVLTPNIYLTTNHSIIIPENNGIFVVDDKTPPPAPLQRTVLYKQTQTNGIQTNKTNETNNILTKQTETNEFKQTGAQP
jgi:hypothetical protein